MNLNLGHTRAGRPVTWCNAENPHLSVSGRSGSGKSYFAKGLLEQAAQAGATCIVLDYSRDFAEYTPPYGVTSRRMDVSSPDFTLNPLACVGEVGAEMCAQRLLSAIHAAFRLGSKGSLALRKVALEYLKGSNGPTLEGLVQHIAGQNLSAGLAAALEPLDLLASLLHTGDGHISLNLDVPGITVLGFRQIQDTKIRVVLVELILTAIWDSWTADPRHDHPLILLLDECQNLNWAEGGMAVRILREGRKFGIAGWFSSQWISNKNAIPALAQAALQAYFRPDDINLEQQAKRLGQGDQMRTLQYRKLLRSLKVGQFILWKANGEALAITVPSRD